MRGSELAEAMASTIELDSKCARGHKRPRQGYRSDCRHNSPGRWEGHHELFGGLLSRDGNDGHSEGHATGQIRSGGNTGHPGRGARGTGRVPDLGRVRRTAPREVRVRGLAIEAGFINWVDRP